MFHYVWWCHEVRTRALKQEAEYISRNERLRQSLPSYQRVPLSIYKEDDATEYNIYRSCEQTWSDENKQRLHNVGTESPDIVVREEASDKAYDLNFS
jgi:hypothetical protein